MGYIILTNKDTYQTDLTTDGIELIETYDYYFFDKLKASYTIAKVTDNKCKIRIIEETPDNSYINNISVKFFEAFTNIEDARHELHQMVGEKSQDQKLVKVS
jgi:hypothetical protein